jgi:hypothetical protein
MRLKAIEMGFITRRAVLRGGLLMGCVAWLTPSDAFAQPQLASRRLSIGEPEDFRTDSVDRIQRRFALYKSIGIGTIRCSVRWNQMEATPGNWTMPADLAYLREAKRSRLALKLLISTMGSIPKWLIASAPNVELRDQYGETTQLSMSYWHPQLHEFLARSTDALFKELFTGDLLEAGDMIIVDLGAAGEAKYPSAWNMREAHPQSPFWYFDQNAARNFSNVMAQKYGDVARANAAWSTHFDSWDAVQLPLPNTHPGQFWNDLLTWYRDSKRAFIAWQIGNYQECLRKYAANMKMPLVVLVPGEHITAEQWKADVLEGGGDKQAAAMIDTEFVIQTAARAGCWLQYTGAQDEKEVRWIREYLNSNGFGNVPCWGENAGSVPNQINNPQRLVDIANAYSLYGVEYINASNVFGSDRITPNEWFEVLRTAYGEALKSFASRT